MGTRSTISILKTDGSVKSVYCHWDGYPENNGVLLLIDYQDAKKVNKLIELGSLSSLRERVEPSIDESHSYDNPVKDVTVAYGRDRQETDVDAVKYSSKEEWEKEGDFQEYDYIFNEKKNKWYLYNPTSGKYSTLVSVVKKVQDEMHDERKVKFNLYLKEQKALKDYNKMDKEINNKNKLSNVKPKV